MDEQVIRLKACLNGNRAAGAHPGLPVTAAQLAAAAAACAVAGADAVHVHPRGGDGRESLRAGDVGDAVAAIRAASPGLPVGVTTAAWITGHDLGARREQVAAWAGLPPERRPGFASVNISEPGWQELTAILSQAGIGAEAGVWTVADAAAIGSAGLNWARILVEVRDAPAAALQQAGEILAILAGAGLAALVLLHGEDSSCWPLISRAGALGLATRIGLEDVLAGPHGEAVDGNADLVALARSAWSAAGHADNADGRDSHSARP